MIKLDVGDTVAISQYPRLTVWVKGLGELNLAGLLQYKSTCGAYTYNTFIDIPVISKGEVDPDVITASVRKRLLVMNKVDFPMAAASSEEPYVGILITDYEYLRELLKKKPIYVDDRPNNVAYKDDDVI